MLTENVRHRIEILEAAKSGSLSFHAIYMYARIIRIIVHNRTRRTIRVFLHNNLQTHLGSCKLGAFRGAKPHRKCLMDHSPTYLQ